jgi:hypothetical protein
MTADVDADTLASFNSLLVQRGGARVFTDFQLDCAIAVVEMLKDLRNRNCSPADRVKTAKGAADLLELLPPIVSNGGEKRIITITTESTLHDAAAAYAAMIADLDTEVEFVGPVIDATVAPPPPAQPVPENAPQTAARASQAPYTPSSPDAQAPARTQPAAAFSPDPAPRDAPDPVVVPLRRPIDYDRRLAGLSIMHVPSLREDA